MLALGIAAFTIASASDPATDELGTKSTWWCSRVSTAGAVALPMTAILVVAGSSARRAFANADTPLALVNTIQLAMSALSAAACNDAWSGGGAMRMSGTEVTMAP